MRLLDLFCGARPRHRVPRGPGAVGSDRARRRQVAGRMRRVYSYADQGQLTDGERADLFRSLADHDIRPSQTYRVIFDIDGLHQWGYRWKRGRPYLKGDDLATFYRFHPYIDHRYAAEYDV